MNIPFELHWFWAKLGKEVWPERYHPVVCHLIDVGCVAREMWKKAIRQKVKLRVSEQLNLSVDEAGAWVAFWTAAHDIGKVTPCFQAQGKSEALKKRLFTAKYDAGSGEKHHTDTGTKVFHDLLINGGNGAWPKTDREVAQKVAVATGGHHGTFPTNWSEVSANELGNAIWTAARIAILADLAQRFGVVGLDSPKLNNPHDQSVWMVLAGLTSVADWIGSNVTFFPPLVNGERSCDEPLDLADYFQWAGGRAAEALTALGWLDRDAPTQTPRSFPEVTGIATPRPLQEEIVRIAESMTSPQLVIVEAPMGEGKTEAAWYVADCWDRRGGAGTYVALPTMATSNQMFDRVQAFLAASQGRSNLMLQHGKASLNDHFEKLQFAAKVYDNDCSRSASGVVAEEWFAKNKKHGLLAPFGVGTIDQVLLAVLQTKHVFVRLFGLAGKCVILDEVHAYDAYMTTLMERLLRWLAALGCPVVLLSATLPKEKRARLLNAYAGDSTPEPKEESYPRVTTVAVGGTPDVKTVAADPARAKTVHLNWLPEEKLAETLRTALTNGGCAAVIRNTVGLAQSTYTQLKEKLGPDFEVELFHARFPFGRRQEIEERVLKRYGRTKEDTVTGGTITHAPHRPRKAVLVATQVIEQSLDLDFDVMVSDVAPVDLVLQRAGRLHRHNRGDRGKPNLWLIEPGEKDGRTDFGHSEWVYTPYVLFNSLLALKRMAGGTRTEIHLPSEIDGLIEEVYSCVNTPAGLSDAENRHWEVTKAEHEAIQGKEEDEALIRQIKKPSFSGALARIVGEPREEDSPELHPAHQALTRLTRPTLQLICLTEDSDGTLRTPHDGKPVPTLQVRKLSAGGSEDMRRLLNAELGVADMRVLRELWANPMTPAEWEEVAMLKKHHLIVFRDGVAVLGGAELRLDMQLGLQVTRSESEGDE